MACMGGGQVRGQTRGQKISTPKSRRISEDKEKAVKNGERHEKNGHRASQVGPNYTPLKNDCEVDKCYV